MDSESLPGRLQRYLLKQIPISQGLGISVTEASLDEILITAPLAPNLNHHGTAFGGSVSAVAILSGWALVYARLEAEGQFPGVVIQYNEIRYLKPLEVFLPHELGSRTQGSGPIFCKVCRAMAKLGRSLRLTLREGVE